jgi:hypothetical protein
VFACTVNGRAYTIVSIATHLPITVSRMNTAIHPIIENGHQIRDGSLLVAVKSFHGQKKELN